MITVIVAPGAAAVLRLEVGGLDSDLRDGVQCRGRVVGAVLAGVLVGDAVVREVERRPAVDRQVVHVLPTRRLTVSRVDDPRQQLEHAGEVAALEGDVVDVLARDQSGARAIRGLHLHGFGLDGHGFREAADLERNRAQSEPLGGPELDAFLFVGLESADRDREVVLASEQVGKHERAVPAGDRFTGGVRAGVLDRDGGAGKYAAARIGDEPGNLAGQPLSLNGTGEASGDDREGERNAGEAIEHQFLLLSVIRDFEATLA